MPIPISFTLIPLGIEALLAFTKWAASFPAFLVLGVLQVAIVLWRYRLALNWQGDLLQKREQKILQIVSSQSE